jgi:hypothetical protein
VDAPDEGRRPPSSIKSEPPLWISSRNPSSSSPWFLSSPTETLAPAGDHRRRFRSTEASPPSPGAPLRRLGSPGELNRRGKVSISGFSPISFAANSPESARLRSPPSAIHPGDHLGSTQVRIRISWASYQVVGAAVARRHRRPLSGRRSRVRRSKLRWPKMVVATTTWTALVSWIFPD